VSETKKIALACAIGGAIGTAVALMVAVAFWWLGLLAGFCAGYVSYEFRAVLRAIPEAWRMTVAGMDAGTKAMIHEVRFFFVPHPIFHTSILFGLVGVGLLYNWEFRSYQVPELVGLVIGGFLVGLVMFFLPLCLYDMWQEARKVSTRFFERVVTQTYRSEPACGYGELGIAFAKGFGIFVCYMIVAGPAIVYWLCVKGIPVVRVLLGIAGRFVLTFVRLIHSDKRLLCGVDSAIGTGLAYVTLARPEMTTAQYVLVVAAGAMIGAAFGVLNWEIVSKRILRVAEQNVPRS